MVYVHVNQNHDNRFNLYIYENRDGVLKIDKEHMYYCTPGPLTVPVWTAMCVRNLSGGCCAWNQQNRVGATSFVMAGCLIG